MRRKTREEFEREWKRDMCADVFRFSIYSDAEKEEKYQTCVRKNFSKARVDESGIIRWKSNDRVPFDDVLSSFVRLGLIDWNNAERSSDERARDTEEFFRRSWAQTPESGYIGGERLSELRADAGRTGKVVDIARGVEIDLSTGRFEKIVKVGGAKKSYQQEIKDLQDQLAWTKDPVKRRNIKRKISYRKKKM